MHHKLSAQLHPIRPEHSHMPPWPNGQGVGLLIRRLRVRVPQGVLFLGSSMHKPRSNHRMPWRLFCSVGICHTQQAKPSGCKNAPLEARIPNLGVSPTLQRNGLRKRLLAKNGGAKPHTLKLVYRKPGARSLVTSSRLRVIPHQGALSPHTHTQNQQMFKPRSPRPDGHMVQ